MAIANYWHVTQTGAGLKNGTNWANAFDEPALEVFLEGAVVAGDVIFVMKGTYTLDSIINFSARPGTAVSPIAIIGVKDTCTNVGAAVTYSDWARSAVDRPFFDCAAFYFQTGNYVIIRNLYFQGSANLVLLTGNYTIIENSKFDNDNAVSAAKYAVSMGAQVIFYNNEISSINTFGLSCASNCRIKYNYFHDIQDAANGISIVTQGDGHVIEFNIFNNTTLAIQGISRDFCVVDNNTFYNCDTALTETNGERWVVSNNIVEASITDGFKWTTQTDINFFWNNHGNDARCTDMWDGVDITTVFKDYPNATLNGDPVFTAAGSDFSLDTGSPCLDAGMSITLGV